MPPSTALSFRGASEMPGEREKEIKSPLRLRERLFPLAHFRDPALRLLLLSMTTAAIKELDQPRCRICGFDRLNATPTTTLTSKDTDEEMGICNGGGLGGQNTLT